jgi:MFS family permease
MVRFLSLRIARRHHRRNSSRALTRPRRNIFALLAFAAGFARSPVRRAVLRPLGDLVGRKYTFLVTIVIMGMSTFIVGVLPNYATWGIAAPIILIALRCCRVLRSAANTAARRPTSPSTRRTASAALYTSWIQTTATLGLFLSLLSFSASAHG